MFRLIGLLVVLALGMAGGLGWDRHPAWGMHLNLLIAHPGFDLPDSLKTERDKALAAGRAAQAALAQCHTNVSTLDGALRAQNKAVEALKAEGDARVAVSDHAASQARAVAQSYRENAAAILGASRGSQDACEAADALILKEAGR